MLDTGYGFIGISIHALREEGDGAARAAERSRQYFYPRPPRGGRRTTSKMSAGP